MTGTPTVHQHFIGPAGRAGIAIGSRPGPSRTELASPINSAQPSQTGAKLGAGVIYLVCPAFPGTDAPLIGEEPSDAVTLLRVSVVG